MLGMIFNRTKTVEKAMDASWLRNEAIAQNIANVDTPGYKRKTVAFEQFLNDAIDNNGISGFRTDKRHIPIGRKNVGEVEPEVTEDNSSLSVRLDGNNVDIENEMADMAKNSIKYNVLTQSLSSRFRSMKSVINEGRR